LYGSGTVNTGTVTGGILSIANGGSFSGSFTGIGEIDLTGETLLLNSPFILNPFPGNITISNSAILQAGTIYALSENSILTLQDSAQLQVTTAGIHSINQLLGGVDTIVSLTSEANLNVAGGNFDGTITGAGGITCLSNVLFLSNANTYTGATTINNGGTLALTGNGALSITSPLVVNGIFNITGIASSTCSISGNLSGAATGDIEIDGKELCLNAGNGTFLGGIHGTDGSLLIQGGGTLILGSANNDYSGKTTIGSGTIQAGIANAFSPESAFIVNNAISEHGILNLNNLNNKIKSLSGDGAVKTGTGAGGILTISDDCTFDGIISEKGGVTLNSGAILTLTNANTFEKPATISSGAQLLLTGSGQLLSTGSVVVHGIFDIQSITSSTTIGDLSGSTVGVVKLDDKELILGTAATTTFNGRIQGTGGSIVKQGTGTLILSGSNKNTYTGSTTISEGTLQAGVVNGFASLSAYTVAGTLDLNNYANTIKSLDGSGTILTGGSSGILTITNGGSFDGNFKQSTPPPITLDGGLSLTGGTLTLTPSISNIYTGSTQISSGATLIAGNTSALAPLSEFTIDGTLNLYGNDNTIGSLYGAGTIETLGGTLSVANGGWFTGQIQGYGGLTLNAGTLDLEPAPGSNTYYGQTTINAGATLEAWSTGSLSVSSAFVMNGASFLTLEADNSIASLTDDLAGSSQVNLDWSTLTISGGATKTFTGRITGTGGLTIDGNTSLTLTKTIPAPLNDYSGPTTINQGTLIIGADSALSPNSKIIVSPDGILDFGTFDNLTLGSITRTLTSSGTVTNEGMVSFPAISITGGTLTNTGAKLMGDPTLPSTISVSGGTVINGTTGFTQSSSQLGNYTATVSLTGGKIENNAAIYFSTYTQEAGATLQLGFFGDDPSVGTVTGTTGSVMTLNGDLVVKWLNGAQPATGGFLLLQTPSEPIQGKFSSATGSGFSTTPRFVYSLHDVSMYFGGASSEWIYDGDGNWGNSSNWSSQNVPGVQGNTDDVAIFNDRTAALVTVILADSGGTTSQSVILKQMIFNSPNTIYTISQFIDQGTITFDSTTGTPEIQAISGYPKINAPIQLNKDTNLILSDGAQLTFTSNTTLQSTDSAAFNVIQSAGTGSGVLINNGVMSPYVMSITGGEVDNYNLINPLTDLTIGATSGTITAVLNNYSDVTPDGMCTIGGSGSTTVSNIAISATIQPVGELLISGAGSTTLENSGTSAIVGPTGDTTPFTISVSGPATILNDGTDAKMGPSGKNANFIVSPIAGGVATMTNSGPGAEMGPFGEGGNFNVGGVGTINITNTGLRRLMGALGVGGNVTIDSGTIQNLNGAIFEAGSGGVFNMTGGTVINDLTSILGSHTANMLLSGGLLNTSGDVLAFDFTQNGSSTLKLNLTNMPEVFGKVLADGTANLGTNLIVDAFLTGNLSEGQIIKLLIANDGVIGTFANVDFQNFPASVIPAIFYTPTTVELGIAATVTPNPSGSLTQLTSSMSNAMNFLVGRRLFDVHNRLINKKKKKQQEDASIALLTENEEISDNSETAFCERTKRKQFTMAQKNIKKPLDFRSGRVYLGPMDSFGEFQSKGISQTGFGYNIIGAVAGADYAFSEIGLGVAVDYSKVDAKVRHHAGFLDLDQIHGCAYGIWVPSSMQALAINAIAGGAYDWYTIKRVAGMSLSPMEAIGQPSGSLYNALLGAEYLFSNDRYISIPNNLSFTPLINLQYVHAEVEQFNEHGASIYNLKQNLPEANFLYSTVGARLDYLVSGDNITFQPELDFGWQYQYVNQNDYAGFSTIQLPQPKNMSMAIVGAGRNTLWLGADFLITICKVYQVEMSYDLQWNRLYTFNSFYLGIGGEF
jgi:autotransporter-associated beta strand protein